MQTKIKQSNGMERVFSCLSETYDPLRGEIYRLNLNLQETLYIASGRIVLATHEGNKTAFKSDSYRFLREDMQDELDKVVNNFDNVENIGFNGYSLSLWTEDGEKSIGAISYELNTRTTKAERFLKSEGVLEQFKANMKFDDHLEDEGGDMDCIITAFNWDDSPEGFNFWSKLDIKFRESFTD